MSDGRATPPGGPGEPVLSDDVLRMLADEAVWTDPPADLEDRVVADITRARLAELDDAPPQPREATVTRLPRRWAWAAGVAATAAAAALAVLLVLPREGVGFELDSTELAAGASALAVIESTPSGDAITMTIEGLAPAPEGFFYQAWVRGDRGLVSVGTFHMRGGDGEVELWSGVDVDDYPTLSVTIEPEDGDQTSSGEAVLVGPIPRDR